VERVVGFCLRHDVSEGFPWESSLRRKVNIRRASDAMPRCLDSHQGACGGLCWKSAV
jgi:hypothetical protein